MKSSDPFAEAFPDLFRAAFRAAYAIGGSRQAAEEAANEALYRASVRWTNVGDRALPWVVRVSSNLAYDHLRKDERRTRAHRKARPEPTGPRADPGDAIDLHRAIRALPRRQREVVTLRYFADQSEADIAAFLGIATGTVKAHTSRAVEALRSTLEDVHGRTTP